MYIKAYQIGDSSWQYLRDFIAGLTRALNRAWLTSDPGKSRIRGYTDPSTDRLQCWWCRTFRARRAEGFTRTVTVSCVPGARTLETARTDQCVSDRDWHQQSHARYTLRLSLQSLRNQRCLCVSCYGFGKQFSVGRERLVFPVTEVLTVIIKHAVSLTTSLSSNVALNLFFYDNFQV